MRARLPRCFPYALLLLVLLWWLLSLGRAGVPAHSFSRRRGVYSPAATCATSGVDAPIGAPSARKLK
jgi:hypothetical protein